MPQHRRVLGETIRIHRKRAGFSQEKLAERADLSSKYVGEVERSVLAKDVAALLAES